MIKEKPIDIAIVGAGAAGLMAAIWAGRVAGAENKPLNIVLFDTRQKIGAKILMSGGTRCNVTHRRVSPSDFQGGPSHFVKHVLKAFTSRETIQFFEEIGVRLVLEPTGKYFPVSNSAQTVLDALINETQRVDVALKTGIRITAVRKVRDLFMLSDADGAYYVSARKIILTTGGLSYPTTGSDGTGYKIAEGFGHSIVCTVPALTPFLTDDLDWKGLSGISLDTRLSFYKNGKKACAYRGAFLFTHFGFSGPVALDMSRHFASAGPEEKPQIIASFLPEYYEETFLSAFQDIRKKNPKRQIKNVLTDVFLLPGRFVDVVLKKAGMNGRDSIGTCSGEDRKQLIRMLLNVLLEITRVFGFTKAEVTAGGLNLKEVHVSTMESKLADGLYFAGEMMDADGRIGGFNFQWAWSTGAVAGRSAARSFVL